MKRAQAIIHSSVLLALCFLAPAALADFQKVTGSYKWMAGDKTAKGSDGVISPTSATVYSTGPGSQSAEFKAKPPLGRKVVAWYYCQDTTKPSQVSSYQFLGGDESLIWVYDADYGSPVVLGLELDLITYSLKYSGESSTLNYIYTNEVTIANCSQTKTGYSFSGSWTNATGKAFSKGLTYKGEDFNIVNRDDTAVVTLYPEWNVHTYSISYDLAGGQAGTSQPTTVTYDKWFLVTDPQRVGYAFKGWTIEGTKGTASSSQRHEADKTTEYRNLTPDDNGQITFTATWQPCVYTVTFNNHGASSGLDQRSVTYDAAYAAVNVPVKSGSNFRGYYTTDDAQGVLYWTDQGQPVKPSWDIPSNVTFHARWQTSQIFVEYDANGGEGTISSQQVDYGATVKLSDGTGMSRQGCNLLGWSESSSATVPQYDLGSEQSFQKTTKLYAVWQMYYYVLFKANGGSGDMPMAQFTYTEVPMLPANTYTKTGYRFGGWATNEVAAVSLVPKYSDCQLITEPLSLIPGSTNELWAVWMTNTYYVAYDPGEGSVDPDAPMPVQTFVYDQTQALTRCTFKAPGELYQFDKWLAKDGSYFADGETVSNLCAEAGVTNTLVATWKLDVGEWSEHMHCTTLRWGTTRDGLGGPYWEQKDGSSWGYGPSGKCVRQEGGSWNTKNWLQTVVQTNGFLRFKAKWQQAVGSTASSVQLNIGLTQIEGGTDFNNNSQGRYGTSAFAHTSVVFTVSGEWIAASVPIRFYPGDEQVYIRLAVFTGTDEYVEIDQMEWIPEGSGGDEPQPGVDNPTVTGISFEGGKIVIRSTGNAKFGYQVLSTLSLAPADWQVESASYQAGQGEGQTFELPVDSAQPQKFYKVEVLKKK